MPVLSGKPLPLKLGSAVTAICVGGLFAWGTLVVENITDSMSRGYYIRDVFDASPSKGDIVFFRRPENVRQYFAASDSWSIWFDAPRNGMLKTVVATSGDVVCDTDGKFSVNGYDIVSINYDIPNSDALPRIGGCIRLAHNEVAVATNSARGIDSRYFGAVRTEDCTVYLPLWMWR